MGLRKPSERVEFDQPCLLPHAHAQRVKQSVCTSVVVVVVVGTKIATLGDLGIRATRKHAESSKSAKNRPQCA